MLRKTVVCRLRSHLQRSHLGTVRPNPRLFQVSQAAAVSAARSAREKAKSR